MQFPCTHAFIAVCFINRFIPSLHLMVFFCNTLSYLWWLMGWCARLWFLLLYYSKISVIKIFGVMRWWWRWEKHHVVIKMEWGGELGLLKKIKLWLTTLTSMAREVGGHFPSKQVQPVPILGFVIFLFFFFSASAFCLFCFSLGRRGFYTFDAWGK